MTPPFRVRVWGTGLIALLLPIGVAAQIALQAPPIVPAYVPQPERGTLIDQRRGLEQRKGELERGVDSLNAECGRVDSSDTAAVSACRARNVGLKEGIAAYRRDLAAFRCALSNAAIPGLRQQVASTQDAIRNVGFGTSVEAYNDLEEMTKQQRTQFIADMQDQTMSAIWAALTDVAIDLAKAGTLALASTGTAQGKHYIKMARSLGIDNPDVIGAIDALSKAEGKPAQARALNELIDKMKPLGKTSVTAYKAGSAESDGERAWRLAALGMLFVKQLAPEMVDRLATKLPTLAFGAVRQVTISTGLAVAPAGALFIHNMRVMGHTDEAIEQLDIATHQQLDAVRRLDVRMKSIVSQLKEQRSVQSGCRSL